MNDRPRISVILKTGAALLAGIIIHLAPRPAFSASASSQEIGTVNLNGKLVLEYYYHRLGNFWTQQKAGYKDTNYSYTYNETTSTIPSWSGSFGQTMYMNFGLRPNANLWGDFGFRLKYDYADRYWLPMNYEHRMQADNIFVFMDKTDANWQLDWMKLRYFRGLGHYHWGYEGDMFNLFPEQFETEKYLRLTGRPIPEGFEIKMSGRAGKLLLMNGPEIVWDHKNATYAKYDFYLSRMKSTFIYTDYVIPYGNPDETMRTFELSAENKVAGRPLMLGVMYRPFRLNKEYEYIEDVAEGLGDLGTRYLKRTGTTSSSDAAGYSLSYNLMPKPVLNDFIFKYTKLGLVAGNKHEYSVQANKTFSRVFYGGVNCVYRKPVIGPMPLLYEGTDGSGPAMFTPRNSQSPFWVNWDNREASLITTVLTFDPTPGTWFYLYQPNLPDEWNLNPSENSPLSFAARYTMARYFTTTDCLYYYDSMGKVLWESSLVTGAWPTAQYIGFFDITLKMALRRVKLTFDVGAGDSLPTSSYAYTTSTAKEKPGTGSFTAGFSVAGGRNKLKLRYSQDVWGPEEWHRGFGQTFDKLYQADFSRKLGDHVEIGAGYTGAREVDKKYFASELGDYDEIKGYFSLAFGPLIGVFEGEPEDEVIGEAPPQDNIPPQVTAKTQSPVFSPNGDSVEDTLPIELFASDENQIESWKLTVKDEKGRTVKTLSGKGEPPYSVEWDGTDDIYEKTVPQGKYSAVFEARDSFDNSAAAAPVNISVSIPPQVVIKEVTKEVKVTETDRGLLVSLTSNVLFDSGKARLKPSANKSLQELVKILNAYKDNNISVEGHTDNIGSPAANQKLSEERAKGVAEFLESKGIARNRITSKGYGKDKPVASNSTAAGREANRRVEVIILKKDK